MTDHRQKKGLRPVEWVTVGDGAVTLGVRSRRHRIFVVHQSLMQLVTVVTVEMPTEAGDDRMKGKGASGGHAQARGGNIGNLPSPPSPVRRTDTLRKSALSAGSSIEQCPLGTDAIASNLGDLRDSCLLVRIEKLDRDAEPTNGLPHHVFIERGVDYQFSQRTFSLEVLLQMGLEPRGCLCSSDVYGAAVDPVPEHILRADALRHRLDPASSRFRLHHINYQVAANTGRDMARPHAGAVGLALGPPAGSAVAGSAEPDIRVTSKVLEMRTIIN